jgi:poly(3-hydroxybutyrate) depolymerase
MLSFFTASVLALESIDEPIQRAGDNAPQIEAFLQAAESEFGDKGRDAAEFLIVNMPAADLQNLSSEFLTENLQLAFRARKEFPWCAELSEERFLNDVLPYACLDEPRDPWRPEFFPIVAELVSEAGSASEAAQIINRDFFDIIKVHYNTGRKRANQSPRESMDQGIASCTGLSIILVDACRAAGIPARIAGTPMWTNKRGNHTWVEVWDDGWHFTGADEYDPQGLNRGWFVGDAAKAIADEPRYAIYASSWKDTGTLFPLPWNRRQSSVFAENVTERYTEDQAHEADKSQLVYIRVFADPPNGERLAVEAELLDASLQIIASDQTRAGQTDLNDMPAFECPEGELRWLKLTHQGASRGIPLQRGAPDPVTVDLVWPEIPSWGPDEPAAPMRALEAWLNLPAQLQPARVPRNWVLGPLSKSEASEAAARLWQTQQARLAGERKQEIEDQAISLDGKNMRLLEKTFGEAPESGRSLWISMHGGGGAPTRVNDQQWQNQIRLYEPEEGIVVAPRAPTDNWNLWHESHIDHFFDRLIADYVVLRGVNPNKVYLMGYSAGGDGVYQLAPRMADRFAAASMMAGHPNDASPLGLRNLPFAIFVGGKDAAYNRNKVAVEWAEKLDALAEEYPGGYTHMLRVYPESGHWMNLQDKEALPWMAQFTRNPWPQKVVWHQSNVTHERFYWLAVPEGTAQPGAKVQAQVDGQNISIQADIPALVLRLSDQLLDLDQPIQVEWNDKTVFQGKIQRSIQSIAVSLDERADPASAASAVLELSKPVD